MLSLTLLWAWQIYLATSLILTKCALCERMYTFCFHNCTLSEDGAGLCECKVSYASQCQSIQVATIRLDRAVMSLSRYQYWWCGSANYFFPLTQIVFYNRFCVMLLNCTLFVEIFHFFWEAISLYFWCWGWQFWMVYCGCVRCTSTNFP